MADQQQQEPQGQQQLPPQQPPQINAAQLLAYVQQLEGQIQELQAIVPQIPQAPAPNPNAGPKPSKPPNFGGKVNESVDSWIFFVDQYRLIVPMPDERFIPFAASFLTDHAATWWRHIYMEQE